MKKRIKCLLSILLSFIMIIGTAIVVSAVEPRFSDTSYVDVQLRITGTTASCTVSVFGADGTTSISDGHLILTDSMGNIKGDWPNLSSNSDILVENRTATNLIKGETYTLSFTATVNRKNGSEPVSDSITKTC